MAVMVAMAVVLGVAALARRVQRMPRVSPPALKAWNQEGFSVAVAAGP